MFYEGKPEGKFKWISFLAFPGVLWCLLIAFVSKVSVDINFHEEKDD